MIEPRVWTDGELREDARAAREVFRKQRTAEPLEEYVAEFDAAKMQFELLFDDYNLALIDGFASSDIAAIAKAKLLGALRYVTGPPISADDLKTIADVSSIAPAKLAGDEEAAAKVLAVVKTTLDPRRFPWVKESRRPTDDEKRLAVFASAALTAGQKIATARRGAAKRAQEAALKAALTSLGYSNVKARSIQLLHEGPNHLQFCGESKVGPTRADVVARLRDGRLLLIECKVSNSAVNSYKRVNHEAAGKAEKWIGHFGKQVVPAAILSGVFKVEDLIAAQGTGLRIYWAHDLSPLIKFLSS